MNGIKLGASLLLLLAIASTASAGVERAGTTAANFLSVGSGAGVLGMGGATLGLSNGLASTSWNVGSLGFLKEGELVLSHANLAEQSSQEWASFGGMMGVGQMRWAVNGLFQSEGSFDGRDASNNSTGSFNVSSMALGGQVAQPIGRHASLGVGAKWVRESLGPGSSGQGMTFDAGLLVRAGMVGFGVAGQNLGGKMTFGSETYPFASNVGAGLSITHAKSGLEFDVDVNSPSDYYTNVRSGVQWSWRDRLALRSGYRKELGAMPDDALNGPTFGMGAGVLGMWMDYGYLLATNGAGQHRLGFSFRPGKMNWSAGDPFGQKTMPNEFGPAESAKPAPSAPAPKTPKK